MCLQNYAFRSLLNVAPVSFRVALHVAMKYEFLLCVSAGALQIGYYGPRFCLAKIGHISDFLQLYKRSRHSNCQTRQNPRSLAFLVRVTAAATRSANVTFGCVNAYLVVLHAVWRRFFPALKPTTISRPCIDRVAVAELAFARD